MECLYAGVLVTLPVTLRFPWPRDSLEMTGDGEGAWRGERADRRCGELVALSDKCEVGVRGGAEGWGAAMSGAGPGEAGGGCSGFRARHGRERVVVSARVKILCGIKTAPLNADR